MYHGLVINNNRTMMHRLPGRSHAAWRILLCRAMLRAHVDMQCNCYVSSLTYKHRLWPPGCNAAGDIQIMLAFNCDPPTEQRLCICMLLQTEALKHN